MTRAHERGLATLTMCVVLLGVLALGAAWAARQLVTAQRVAANDLRAATASEAADSGTAWAVALLNSGVIDDTCRSATTPSAAGGTTPSDFRSRFLLIGPDGHYHAPPSTPASPATPSTPPAASTGPAMPTCVNSGPLRWSCRCAATAGAPASPAAPGDAEPRADGEAQAQFSIRFADAGAAGQLKLIVRGCSDRRPDCDDVSGGPVGVVETSQQLALLSALRLPPASALINTPGSFLQVFGFPPGQYRDQPAVTRLRCIDDCGAPLAQALARGRRLIWIDGDARLAEWPASALDGSPLVLIVDGRLDLFAPGHPQGVIYVRDGLAWHPPAGQPASLRGAVISDGPVDNAASVQLIHDAAVLYRIHRQMGSFLPVPGGWTPTR